MTLDTDPPPSFIPSSRVMNLWCAVAFDLRYGFLQLAQKVMEHSLQYSVAWFSSQPSHTTLLGSAWLLLEEEEGEAAASTVDAKWLMGREEAAVVPCPFCFSSSFLVVILKTARHIGHLKGALPISSISIQENELLIAITSES